MTLSITTVSMVALFVTISKMTLGSIDIQHKHTQCRFHYAESHDFLNVIVSAVMLTDIMMSVIMLNVVIQSVVALVNQLL